MTMKGENHEALSTACKLLQQSKKTLLLSSLSQSGNPEISYTPYISDSAGNFYIFISDLAAHATNLRHHANASVMFIADEDQSQNLFARERITYQCNVTELCRTDKQTEEMLDSMATSFGNIISMLRGLGDFNMFRLTPVKGSYVVGFGKAYAIDPRSGELEHISEGKLKTERGNKE